MDEVYARAAELAETFPYEHLGMIQLSFDHKLISCKFSPRVVSQLF